ncbi:hypothetical protein ACEPAG_7545 [Sanghuangporus baumii]
MGWEGIARRLFGVQRVSFDRYELVPSAEDGRGTHARRSSPIPRKQHSLRSWPARAACFTLLHFLTPRRIFAFLASILAFLVFGVLWSGIPPSYETIREFEHHLPQHDLSLPFPEGKDGMYLRFPEHLWGHGLNNVLQELILMSHLAYLSNRSFVFEDYTWSHTILPYTIYDFALRPARIPLNAFISGPSAGGHMRAPRSVSAEYWEKVCPPSKRVLISSSEAPSLVEGDKLLDWWVAKLADTSANCVEVGNNPPVFGWFLFGSDNVLLLWPSLSASPVIRDFSWSPLVTSGVARNLPLLTSTPAPVLPDVIEGLVAVHLRRGDYIRHCPRLARWGATYMGFNQFPELPDRFSPPDFGSLQSLDGREKYYLQHCWPEIDDIVKKLHDVREERPDLQRVYVLTNGWGWWVDRLREALAKDGWADLKSSLDLQVDSEQKYVEMAIDMAIAERAEVFVGNGFSSLSSNIIMLRTAKNMNPRSNRFW